MKKNTFRCLIDKAKKSDIYDLAKKEVEQDFANNLLENTKGIERDFALTVERHFWNLCDTNSGSTKCNT